MVKEVNECEGEIINLPIPFLITRHCRTEHQNRMEISLVKLQQVTDHGSLDQKIFTFPEPLGAKKLEMNRHERKV